jgi:hypothetical protein
MIVIVEGCDKAGKTTLAQTLAARVDLIYYHATISLETNLFEKYVDIIRSINRPTIADRFYPSELVYGPLIRGHSRLSISQFRNLNKMIQIQGGCFIYCFANRSIITDRFTSEEEDYLPISLIPETLRNYKRIIAVARENLPVFTYNSGLSQNTSSLRIEELVSLLQKKIAT